MNAFAQPRALIAIPLKRAALCASCEAVFLIDEWSACPSCDDSHFIPLESVIGTTRSEEKREESA